MAEFGRYALYVMAPSPLHETASAWLGWDCASGTSVAHPQIDGLPDTAETLTATPRKYGFHGTMKPPFRLAEGESRKGLEAACARIIPKLRAVRLDALEVRSFSGFVAMVPAQPSETLQELGGAVVDALDPFRAPPTDDELARRRKSGLSHRQEVLLARWGYPYVMDEFRFHMTLSGKLPTDDADRLANRLKAHFASVMPRPFVIYSLGLLGEDAEGRFHLIETYPLAT